MRSAILGAVLLALGLAAVVFGVMPASDALAVADRVWPVLLFVTAIAVVTELASEAGLFTVVAHRLARWGLNRAWLLWLFIVVLASVATIFLSLDTTAVLLTPVVVMLARHVSLPPLPFALTTVWLANTGSLLLPISNLTNLLAEHKLPGMGPAGFAALMAAPALAAIVVPSVVLFVVFRKDLLRRYEPDPEDAPGDRVLLWISAVVVLVIMPLFVIGIPVWIPALAAAIVLVVAFWIRRREVLEFSLVPWQLVLLASGLFLAMAAAQALGLTTLLASLAGNGEDVGALLRVSGTGALGGNLVNNLPAYLAFEPVAGTPVRLAALLVGVNAGVLITPWASLATLLWHSRLSALDVKISWGRFALLGAVVAPLTVVAATVVLAAAQ